MKRILIITFLLLLLLIPARAFALSCVELNIRYFIVCTDGICDGFKVEEEPKGGACNRIPYVVELKEGEAQQIYHHLSGTTGQIELDGLWEIGMSPYCSSALRADLGEKDNQQLISERCGVQGKHINVNKLSKNSTQESLQARRVEAEKEARQARISFYFSQWSSGTVSVLLGAILPLIIIIRYLTTQNKALILYVALALIAQIGIILYLLSLSISIAPAWATLSVVIVAPLFLVGIGLLIGAKLINRGRQNPGSTP